MAIEYKTITPEEFISRCPAVAKMNVMQTFRCKEFLAVMAEEKALGWHLNQMVTIPFRNGASSAIAFKREV